MISSSAGTTSTISCPFGCTASRIARPPRSDRLLTFGEQLLDEVLERGDERAERHVLLELVELARDEITARCVIG
jgi:hypothetical protein